MLCVFLVLLCPIQKFRSPYLGKAQQLQEQRYPLLSVFAVFPCVQTTVWLSVFGIFNMRPDVDVCDCTRGLYRHRKSALEADWEKSPFLYKIQIEVTSTLRHCKLKTAVTMTASSSGYKKLNSKSGITHTRAQVCAHAWMHAHACTHTCIHTWNSTKVTKTIMQMSSMEAILLLFKVWTIPLLKKTSKKRSTNNKIKNQVLPRPDRLSPLTH